MRSSIWVFNVCTPVKAFGGFNLPLGQRNSFWHKNCYLCV